MKCFDESQPSSYLISYDFNNLYGCCMSQKLPMSDFYFIDDENSKRDIFKKICDGHINEKSSIGYLLELDISIDEKMHDYFDQFPFCPETKAPSGSKHKKLIADLTPKKKYILHYLNVKMTRATQRGNVRHVAALWLPSPR
jgi:hypothetical protein